jgi:Zn-dependent peptidase ImmA (M78 family)
MIRVDVRPEMVRWARERARLSVDALSRRFPKLEAWEEGELRPTLKQLEKFAKATHVPIGFLFLPEPPDEAIPIPDFRTMAGAKDAPPSPDLLDTIYLCQQRQEWFHDFARSTGAIPLEFVGSAQVSDDIPNTAAAIREVLDLDVEARGRIPTWTEALRQFIGRAEGAGILVMCSGVVGNNTSRSLDPEEFRGFALTDDLAPLVFINGADTKAAQMFTLAHELAHVWLGQSAVTDSAPMRIPEEAVEQWCNRVAAELLVPIALVRTEYDGAAPLATEVPRLARNFKVSTLVVLRRIHDAGGLTREELWAAYAAEVERLRGFPRGSGGDFYRTQTVRTGRLFAQALVISTLEGRTLHRDAFRLFGFSKLSTFQELGRSLGVPI